VNRNPVYEEVSDYLKTSGISGRALVSSIRCTSTSTSNAA